MNYRSKESYKHLMAKLALVDQIESGFYPYKPLRIDLEKPFVMHSCILFIPDVVVYDIDGMCALFEIVVTNPLSKEKLLKMAYYFSNNGFIPDVIEVSANEILNRIKWTE